MPRRRRSSRETSFRARRSCWDERRSAAACSGRSSRTASTATSRRGPRAWSRLGGWRPPRRKRSGPTASRVLVSSTGVIGVRLPIETIEAGLVGMSQDLVADPLVGAEGIMTTDTYAKALSATVPGTRATITWVAKGSGMIEPNMATMLAYIFTDAGVDAAALDRALRDAVHVSFNMLSVDTDTSTSDTCAILANGLAGERGRARLRRDAHRRLHSDDGNAGARRRGRRASHPRDGARRGERGGRAARREVARQLAAGEDDGARRRPERRPAADGGRQVLRRASRSDRHGRVDQRASGRARRTAARLRRCTWSARRSPPKRSISRCRSAWATRRRRRTGAISPKGTSRRTRRITRARSRVSGLGSPGKCGRVELFLAGPEPERAAALVGGVYATAIHSISTRAFSASPDAAIALRAGLRARKYVR